MPHLYLDMDGVQADFFGDWARLHRKSHYKDIGDRSAREQSITEIGGRGAEFVEFFFTNLPPLSGGLQIIEWLRRHHIPYTVLSAPMRTEPEASIRGKITWLDNHHPGSSGDAIFTANKDQFATSDGQPNVLVDDFGKYVEAWRDAGGIAIKHSDHHTGETIKQLEKIYAPFL